jgi:PAS domain S-box-containing protein
VEGDTRFKQIFDVTVDEMPIQGIKKLVHPADAERFLAEREAASDPAHLSCSPHQYRVQRRDGEVRWVEVRWLAYFEDEPRERRNASVVGTVYDITERKEREDREHLFMREINHRTKNMLNVVEAIARRTATRNPADFVERFSERIRALSANQDLLVRNEWRGVEIKELVRAQLSHFAGLIGSRIFLDGPKLRLKPASAQAIGLAVHELATNAGKYGALSTDKGRVDVFWTTDDDAFTMRWTEREGPPVSAPKRRGFGTTVVGRMAEGSLGGTVDIDYASSGLTWRLTCPASTLEPREGSSSAWDRTRLLEDFSVARRHVATGERNIARQREIVARLERHGNNALEAKWLLASFEELQNMHLTHLGRLEKVLAESSK